MTVFFMMKTYRKLTRSHTWTADAKFCFLNNSNYCQSMSLSSKSQTLYQGHSFDEWLIKFRLEQLRDLFAELHVTRFEDLKKLYKDDSRVNIVEKRSKALEFKRFCDAYRLTAAFASSPSSSLKRPFCIISSSMSKTITGLTPIISIDGANISTKAGGEQSSSNLASIFTASQRAYDGSDLDEWIDHFRLGELKPLFVELGVTCFKDLILLYQDDRKVHKIDARSKRLEFRRFCKASKLTRALSEIHVSKNICDTDAAYLLTMPGGLSVKGAAVEANDNEGPIMIESPGSVYEGNSYDDWLEVFRLVNLKPILAELHVHSLEDVRRLYQDDRGIQIIRERSKQLEFKRFCDASRNTKAVKGCRLSPLVSDLYHVFWLFVYVLEGNSTEVEKYFQFRSVQFDVKDTHGWTLLYAACISDDPSPKIVSCLLQNGVSANVTSSGSDVAHQRPQHGIVENYWKAFADNRLSETYCDRLCKILRCLKERTDFTAVNGAYETALDYFKRRLPAVGRSPPGVAGMSHELAVRQLVVSALPDFARGSDHGSTGRYFSEAVRYFESNPKLPPYIRAQIIANMWRTPQSIGELQFISIDTSRTEEIASVCRDLDFLPSTMELRSPAATPRGGNAVLMLIVHEWPQQCPVDGNCLTNVSVTWEWLLEGEWSSIEDEDVLRQLSLCSHTLTFDSGIQYTIDRDFIIRGEGVLQNVQLRWLPVGRLEASGGHNVEGVDDDLEHSPTDDIDVGESGPSGAHPDALADAGADCRSVLDAALGGAGALQLRLSCIIDEIAPGDITYTSAATAAGGGGATVTSESLAASTAPVFLPPVPVGSAVLSCSPPFISAPLSVGFPEDSLIPASSVLTELDETVLVSSAASAAYHQAHFMPLQWSPDTFSQVSTWLVLIVCADGIDDFNFNATTGEVSFTGSRHDHEKVVDMFDRIVELNKNIRIAVKGLRDFVAEFHAREASVLDPKLSLSNPLFDPCAKYFEAFEEHGKRNVAALVQRLEKDIEAWLPGVVSEVLRHADPKAKCEEAKAALSGMSARARPSGDLRIGPVVMREYLNAFRLDSKLSKDKHDSFRVRKEELCGRCDRLVSSRELMQVLGDLNTLMDSFAVYQRDYRMPTLSLYGLCTQVLAFSLFTLLGVSDLSNLNFNVATGEVTFTGIQADHNKLTNLFRAIAALDKAVKNNMMTLSDHVEGLHTREAAVLDPKLSPTNPLFDPCTAYFKAFEEHGKRNVAALVQRLEKDIEAWLPGVVSEVLWHADPKAKCEEAKAALSGMSARARPSGDLRIGPVVMREYLNAFRLDSKLSKKHFAAFLAVKKELLDRAEHIFSSADLVGILGSVNEFVAKLMRSYPIPSLCRTGICAQVLAFTLPQVLAAASASDLKFDMVSMTVKVRGTQHDHEKLADLFRAIVELDKAAKNEIKGLNDHVAGLHAREAVTLDPRLSPTNPLFDPCAKYFEAFEEHGKRNVAALVQRLEKDIEAWLPGVVSEVLRHADPQAKCEEAKAALSGMSARARPSGDLRIGPVVMREYLNAFKFNTRIPANQFDTFQDFRVKLLMRTQHMDAPGELVRLLRDFNIHKVSVSRELPFYPDCATRLLTYVSKHDVTVVKTSTGSGKSTLMPLLLLAAGQGYRRIAVTQPRRLAATAVQATIEVLHGKGVCGYSIAGEFKNPKASIMYLTDGLLRRALKSPPPGNKIKRADFAFDVIIIDEVHERSAEIDSCIALFALAKKNDWFESFPKIILSSATFDASVLQPLEGAGLSVRTLSDGTKEPRFTITKHYVQGPVIGSIGQQLRKSSHYIDVVSFLAQKLERGEQLLCFLPSTKEVNTAVDILQANRIPATPMHAQLTGKFQEDSLKTGTIFIATNIAETSLTFPNLRYVVDCGQVMEVKEGKVDIVNASKATLRQRRGRVGRTMDGDYVGLYTEQSRDHERPENIKAKMEIEPFEDLEFSLQFQLCRDEQLHFPIGKKNVPLLDREFKKFPVMGGKAMAKAFYAALRRYHCSHSILALASLLMCFPTNQLQMLASSAPVGGGGDISRVLSAFERLVNVSPPITSWADMNARCNRLGLLTFARYLWRANDRYRTMVAHVREKDPLIRLEWAADKENVIKALAKGFEKNYFVHCHKIDGPVNTYSRLSDWGDGGDSDKLRLRSLYTLHSKCTVAKAKHDIVFGLFISLSNAEMLPENGNTDPCRLGWIQLVEPVIAKNIPSSMTARRNIEISASDSLRGYREEIIHGKRMCVIDGPMQDVVQREIEYRSNNRVLKKKVPVTYSPHRTDESYAEQFRNNVTTMSKDGKQSFRPLKYFWMNSHAMDIEVHMNPADPHFVISGSARKCAMFEGHVGYWSYQLNGCAAVAPSSHWDFTSVSLYRRPQEFSDKAKDKEFRERVHHITVNELSQTEIFDLCEGARATRESRMEIVARIAVKVFGCRLTGGFVRDWVVRGERVHSASPKSDWVVDTTIHGGFTIKEIKKEIIPTDLDVELPMTDYFDVHRFVSEVRECGIVVDFHAHIPQRHVFLFESERGPFTADFIEPHFALLHTTSDLDINTLSIANFPDLVGLKMPYQFDGSTDELEVDGVVKTCLDKRFTSMRADCLARVNKMTARGWHHLGERLASPKPAGDFQYTLTPVPSTTADYIRYSSALAGMTRGAGRLREMYQVGNPIVEAGYAAMKAEFELGTAAINERDLYHGTGAVREILNYDFDDHYWNSSGYFGRGAYFADDPNLSAVFAPESPSGHRAIFICEVLLGTQLDESGTPISTPKGPEFFPPVGYDSVKGRIVKGGTLREMEYIVYRFRQARPKYLLKFSL